jgi:D-alanyl-D-alanine carboxypeptidase/D-alanyl-D-alanine-endopeptidase (penicillin-binding protein 4)
MAPGSNADAPRTEAPQMRSGTGHSAFLVAAGVALLGSTSAAQDLQSDLERVLSSTNIGGAKVGWFIAIVDGDPEQLGGTLASHDGGQGFIPASNMKLITSGAALHVLGADHTFRTEIGMSGETLVVKGAGDPALADPELLERMNPPMTVDDVLDLLAGAVADAGVASVKEIVLDDRVFDREAIHESWPRDQLDRQYCAQVSGLNFHTNVLRVYVAPGSGGVGNSALITTQPGASWIEMENRTRTADKGDNQVWPTRTIGTNQFTVHGQVVAKSHSPMEVTVDDPARFFGNLLADRLRRRGVANSGGVRLAGENEPLELDRVLARITTDIDDVLARCNQDSRNLYAESLLKLIGNRVTGEPGSWTNGPTVVRMLVGQLIDPRAAAEAVIADGSGMSRDNLVSAELLCRWLEAMAEDERIAESYVSSLATPGEGTLRRRFQKAGGRSGLTNELRAKSGYLDGVRSLSGYFTDGSGRMVAFSFLVNEIEAKFDMSARTMLDYLVVEIDRFLTATSVAGVPGG